MALPLRDLVGVLLELLRHLDELRGYVGRVSLGDLAKPVSHFPQQPNLA
jgi:hypothetical protein